MECLTIVSRGCLGYQMTIPISAVNLSSNPRPSVQLHPPSYESQIVASSQSLFRALSAKISHKN